MIYLQDLAVIALGYFIGLFIGFIAGCKRAKKRFWKMPSASWRVRK